MTGFKSLQLLGLACFALTPMAEGAGILVDSFSSGDFLLTRAGPSTHSTSALGTGFEGRFAQGSGARTWTATSDSGSGTLNYTISMRSEPEFTDYFLLRYTMNSSLLSLMGADTLMLHVVGLSGEGTLQAAFGNTPDSLDPAITISGTGEQAFAFYDLFPGGWNDQIGDIHLKLAPKSLDFSITLSEITIIPEAGSTALLLTGGLLMLARRNRS
jgi:hypothetical protein